MIPRGWLPKTPFEVLDSCKNRIVYNVGADRTNVCKGAFRRGFRDLCTVLCSLTMKSKMDKCNNPCLRWYNEGLLFDLSSLCCADHHKSVFIYPEVSLVVESWYLQTCAEQNKKGKRLCTDKSAIFITSQEAKLPQLQYTTVPAYRLCIQVASEQFIHFSEIHPLKTFPRVCFPA